MQWRFTGKFLIGALADGAGSAPHSELGAELACKTALDSIEKEFEQINLLDEDELWKNDLVKSAQAAREALIKEAESASSAPRDYACTLLLFVATPEFVAAFQIGDGAVLIREETGSLLCLTAPADSEYLNETIFITADQAIETARFAIYRQKINGIAAFTDGLQMLALKMPGAVPHAPFFAPLFRFIEQETDAAVAEEKLKGFLTSPRISQRADDDLTLFLAILPGNTDSKTA